VLQAEGTRRVNRMIEGPQMNQSNGIASQHACRILITCALPQDDGKMNVEMSYEGDPALASYLLERARNYIEHNDELNFC